MKGEREEEQNINYDYDRSVNADATVTSSGNPMQICDATAQHAIQQIVRLEVTPYRVHVAHRDVVSVGNILRLLRINSVTLSNKYYPS